MLTSIVQIVLLGFIIYYTYLVGNKIVGFFVPNSKNRVGIFVISVVMGFGVIANSIFLLGVLSLLYVGQ